MWFCCVCLLKPSILQAQGISEYKVTDRGSLGLQVYNFSCYFCHGYSGDAKTLASSMLDPKPRNFTATPPEQLSREQMVAAIKHGRPNTAMKPFTNQLSSEEIEAVVDYIRATFMLDKQERPGYHTLENGWPGHEKYSDAFPFATGEIGLDAAIDSLTDSQKKGRKLYLESCISCHDRSMPADMEVIWKPQALSYPRTGFEPGDSLLPPDAVTGASPFAQHDKVPKISGLSPVEKEGGQLFQENCAFCHAADGTGKNWIGTFLQPPPRDLTDSKFMRTMTPEKLRQRIKDGLPGTSMPAWKSVLLDEQVDAIVAFVHRVFHPLSEE